MKITPEAATVEVALDILNGVAHYTAVDRIHTTTMTDGVLNIGLSKVSGSCNPIVSAIEVMSQQPRSSSKTRIGADAAGYSAFLPLVLRKR
jgi:hypothetical protein